MIEILLAIVMLALPPAVYFPTIGERRSEERNAADEMLHDLDIRIESAKAAQRKLPEFREEVQRLLEENEKLRRILPRSLAIDEVRALTAAAAQDNRLRLAAFKPRTPVAGMPDRQEIEIEVAGTAADTAAFLRRMENVARIFDVSSVTMRKDEAGWRTAFVMTAYGLR